MSVSRELRQLEARHQQQRRWRLEEDKRRLAAIMHQLDTETCGGEEEGQGSRWCQPLHLCLVNLLLGQVDSAEGGGVPRVSAGDGGEDLAVSVR